jgi:hypothetical protein
MCPNNQGVAESLKSLKRLRDWFFTSFIPDLSRAAGVPSEKGSLWEKSGLFI